MGDLFGAGPQLEYQTRLQTLQENHIALWDVIEACYRPGSLDSAISPDGLATNNFIGFFYRVPNQQVFEDINLQYKCTSISIYPWSLDHLLQSAQ